MGYRRMILDSAKEWTKAQSFYKKNGYKETEEEGLKVNIMLSFIKKA